MRIPGCKFCVPVLAMSLISCVSPGTSTYRYQEPTSMVTPKNEVVVNKNFSDTWDGLIGELAKSFFVINNVEKASRIINVSFATDKPEGYVDCGTTDRTLDFDDAITTYKYPLASTSSYKHASAWGPYGNLPVVSSVNRKMSLEGRINIYVAPKGDDMTAVTVNVRYILVGRVSGQADLMNAFGKTVQHQMIPESQSSISFNTGQAETANWNGDAQIPIKCQGTGKLESEVIKLVTK